MRRAIVAVVSAAAVVIATFSAVPSAAGAPGAPPLRTSANVELVTNVPGSFAGLVFKGQHAYATGWATGLTVFDISTPENPVPVGVLSLPHFENEDVELCGNTLLIANDRGTRDLGGVLHVIDITDPTLPQLVTSLPLGLTGEGRGPGHIANFVTADCSQAWIDGGDHVEVVDLSDRAAPRSLGSFRSIASTGPYPNRPAAFIVTHDTERDSTGTLWSVGGGGIAGYRLSADPLRPTLVTRSGRAGININYDSTDAPYNDFILHNSQRAGNTMLVTEEDYVDTSGGDEPQPGSCHGQGKFETWTIPSDPTQRMRPIDKWQTELNGFIAGGGADDSKAPVTANCSSHWFDHRDGVAAVGWYEQGVRFLDVRNPSHIRQIGYYLPADGATWGAYWVPGSKGLVYTADVSRGLDVVRIRGHHDRATPTVTAPILDDWFGEPGTAPRMEGFGPTEAFGWSCVIPLDRT